MVSARSRICRGVLLAFVFSDTRRAIGFFAAEASRRLQRRLALGRLSVVKIAATTPDRLIVAPIDLRTADKHIADEIYAGRFPLSGQVLETFGASPFVIDLPSREFAHRLHSFRWLRHLRAANHELAFSNARALVDEWIAIHGRRPAGIAWEPGIVAERVIAWLSHSPIVLKGADHVFYRRFLKSLAKQVRFLRHMAPTSEDGEVRFRVRIALAMATLAMPSSAVGIRNAARNLDAEIDRQILPDGGHVSRNPLTCLDLLSDLLPLRQTYINLGHTLPQRLIPGIDRMFPAVRFFRHANGELALFNGASAVSADRLLCILRYDESTGRTFREAPHLRYQRLECGTSVLIADTGPPPSGMVSVAAHAGTLAFEFSSGRNRLIVNAGVPVSGQRKFLGLSRSTAAHSTVTIDDTSSSRQSKSSFLGPLIVGGVTTVSSQRLDDGNSQGFLARHDGYRSAFGLFHEREIRMDAEGIRLAGIDRLVGNAAAGKNSHGAVARFHVHPKIELRLNETGDVELITPDGELWVFRCPDVPPKIEQSLFLADLSGPRATQQIILEMTWPDLIEVEWHLVRQRAASA